VSVHSQATPRRRISRKSAARSRPTRAEHNELDRDLHRRGLERAPRAQVATQLMAHDALGAHCARRARHPRAASARAADPGCARLGGSLRPAPRCRCSCGTRGAGERHSRNHRRRPRWSASLCSAAFAGARPAARRIATGAFARDVLGRARDGDHHGHRRARRRGRLAATARAKEFVRAAKRASKSRARPFVAAGDRPRLR
jgi:hypothetical protein